MFDLLQAMHQDGFLTSTEVHALRQTCKELGENQVRVLRSLNIASCEQIQDYLQRYFGSPSLSAEALELINESHQIFMPQDLALYYSCFGLGEDRNVLYVALEDPTDQGTIDQLRFFLNKKIKAVYASVYDIAQGLQKIYRLPIDRQKLSTAIDLSRGVIAGVLYQDTFVEQVHVDENAEIEIESLGLEDAAPPPFINEIEPPRPASPPPPVAFAGPLPAHHQALLETLGSTISNALVKLSLMTNPQEALTLINQLLEPVKIRLELTDHDQFQLEGEDFLFEGALPSPRETAHPLVETLAPVIQKIMRMK